MKNKHLTKAGSARPTRRHAVGLTPRHVTVTVQTPASTLRKNSPYGRPSKGYSRSPQRFQLDDADHHDDDDDEAICRPRRATDTSDDELSSTPTLCGAAAPAAASAAQLPSLDAASEVAFCTHSHTPSHAMFALTQVSSLLQFVSPGALVAFDIDDTLVKKRHFSCSLLTAEGVRALQARIQASLSHLPFVEKQRLLNSLHQHIKSFTLAENETAAVVAALQSRGARVFGLTARAPCLAAATTESLASLGIDLARSPPASLPRRAVEPSTGAAVVDGIVYCGEVEKGVVFQRLLQHGWLSWASPAAPTAASSSLSPPPPLSPEEAAQQSLHPPSADPSACPERTVWFVDDSAPMISSMVSSWVAMARSQAQLSASLGEWSQKIPCRGRMSLVCCHYTHPTAAATAPTPAEAVEGVIREQIDEFLRSGELLSDAEAMARAARSGASVAATSTTFSAPTATIRA